MDVKYHYFWNIIFIVGLSILLFILFFSVSLILRFKYNNYDILKNLDEYEGKLLDVIIRFLFGLIFGGLIGTNLEVQTINIFDPNHLLVCYEISNIFEILYKAKNLREYLSIIPFIIQIIVLLFYLEIFEFNFCELNRNRKRNIQLREREETIEIEDEPEQDINIIELENNYLINFKEEKNIKEEMQESVIKY